MYRQFNFYIHGNQVELAGHEFLLGELTCELLNISPEEFEAMQLCVKK